MATPELGLWVLCDGMGGHQAGAEASRLATEVMVYQVKEGKNLKVSVAAAHAAVLKLGDEIADKEKAVRRPGTTLAALQVAGESYEIVWVGDSRVWLWDGNNLKCLTTDHSVVQDLVNWGDITEAEALNHPQRHQLTQALGVTDSEKLRIEEISGRWQPKVETLFLTSDGAFCHTDPEAAARVLLKTNTPQEIVEIMIAESLARGSEDNITVVAVSCRKSFLQSAFLRMGQTLRRKTVK